MWLPIFATPRSLAQKHDINDRRWHEIYAYRHGYFWMPCILCHRYYGGHELSGGMITPERGEGLGHGICPWCSAEGRGQKSPISGIPITGVY